VTTTNERLLGDYGGRMLATISVSLAMVRLGRRVIPPLLPEIIVDLSITPVQAGIALSTGSIAYAIFQYPSGRLSDQLSRKTIILAGLAVIVIGCLLISLTTTYLLLVLGIVIIGFGEGLYGPADRGLLADLFVEKRGAAFGIHTTFTDIGGIAAAGLASVAIAYGTWKSAFFPIVVGLVVIGGLLLRWGRESIILEPISFDSWETIQRLRLIPQFPWILLAYSLFSVTTVGVLGFLPTFLQVVHNFSPELANTAFAMMFATGIVSRPIAGKLSDSHNRILIGGGGLGIAACGLIMLIVYSRPLVIFIGVVVFAAGMRAFPPTMQAYLMDLFPDGSMAGDLGATRTVYIILGSFGPTFVGFIASQISYSAAFGGLVVALLAGGTVLFGILLTNHR